MRKKKEYRKKGRKQIADLSFPSNDHCLMQVDEEETHVETPPSLLEMVERSEERKAQPVMEETQPIHLGTADEPQEVRIGTTLTLEERLDLLKEYKDAFAWSYDDMPGLSTDRISKKIPLYP